jgi:uncharacterized protein with ParB-like and HNH nuclease domain
METNLMTFESGKGYTLAQIFSGDNKIVIPDLQRDYCWGDSELVSSFVSNLIEIYKDSNDKEVTLGLIYGYEHPKHYIQLCDGQQRITTLFLLLGMLNIKTDNGAFQKYLISDYELKNDDKEPYLQYAIRESTLYFLSDLVCNFFLKKDYDCKIKEQDWYFTEYNLDASIQSMLRALEAIKIELEKIEEDCKTFGEFILNSLEIFYYDIGNRIQGEETFVIINTTGEPLTAAENLKPILIGNIDDENERKQRSNEWEKREEWFWKNKKNEENIADDGINDFFVWYWQIQLLQEKSWKNKKSENLNPKELFTKKPAEFEMFEINNESSINKKMKRWEKAKDLNIVHSYFKALEKLIRICKEDENVRDILKTFKCEEIDLSWFRNSKSDLHIILPLIAYLEKFKEPILFYKFIRRIRKNYFYRKRKIGDFVDWRYIIQIIEFSDTERSVLCFETKMNEDKLKIGNVQLNEWYDIDEQNKDTLKEYREKIEDFENNEDLMGDLTPLWEANEGRDINFKNLSEIYDTFVLLQNCYVEMNSKDYPILSNYVRMYRVLIEEDCRIGSISRAPKMIGVWFSSRNPDENKNHYKYLKEKKYLTLLSNKAEDKENIVKKIKDEIKKILREKDINIKKPKNSQEHLIAWLFIKVLYIEKYVEEKKLLSFNDRDGLASYKECNQNRLNSDLEFTLANSHCGYAKKGVRYKECKIDDNNQGEPNDLNTIIVAIENKKPVHKEKIDTIEKIIDTLLEEFYGKSLSTTT